MNDLIVLRVYNIKKIAKKIIPYILLFVVVPMVGFFGFFYTVKSHKTQYKLFTPVEIKEDTEKYTIQARYPFLEDKKLMQDIDKKLREKLNKFKIEAAKLNLTNNQKYEYNLDYTLYEVNHMASIDFREYEFIKENKYTSNRKVIYYNTFTKTNIQYKDLFVDYKQGKEKLDKIVKDRYKKIYKKELEKEYSICFDKIGIKVLIEDEVLELHYGYVSDIFKDQYIIKDCTVICEYPIFEEEKKEKTRDLSVFEGKKVIALTFDDGPSKITTRLLDELNKRNVKATFFVLGNRIKGHESVIKNMYENGHQIGNHSFSHRNYYNLSKEEVKKEIDNTNTAIKEITGIVPKVTRAPYGNKIDKILVEKELVEINWSIDPEDWRNRNKDVVVQKILSKAVDGDIVLLHDIYDTSVDAALEVVDELKKQGFEFLTISEMFEFKKCEIKYTDTIRSFRKK